MGGTECPHNVASQHLLRKIGMPSETPSDNVVALSKVIEISKQCVRARHIGPVEVDSVSLPISLAMQMLMVNQAPTTAQEPDKTATRKPSYTFSRVFVWAGPDSTNARNNPCPVDLLRSGNLSADYRIQVRSTLRYFRQSHDLRSNKTTRSNHRCPRHAGCCRVMPAS